MKPGDTLTLDLGGQRITATITAVQPTKPKPRRYGSDGQPLTEAERLDAEAAKHGIPPLTPKEIVVAATRLKSTIEKPAPLNLSFQVPGSNRRIKVGHQVRVKPSKPGKHDGYQAIVREAHCNAIGTVTSVSVVPTKRQRNGKVLHGSNNGFRTFDVSRIQPVNQPKQEVPA